MQQGPLGCKIVSVGAWGDGFHNWQDLQDRLQGKVPDVADLPGPKPEVIPANERRRAPLPVRLAVESSWQAAQAANIDPADLNCVFVSALGDTQLTDYMCRVLAGETKMLSPTKFHNSVHNAAAGYWTISAGCRKPANSIAGFAESVPLALLEAITQCVFEQRPTLITFYDAPVSDVLQGLLRNRQPFAVSMVIAPLDSTARGAELQAQVIEQNCDWPVLDLDCVLQRCYDTNPTARILALLHSITMTYSGSESLDKRIDDSETTVSLPLSSATSLQLTV